MNTPPKFLADRLGEIAGRVSVEADRTTIIEATTALRSVAPTANMPMDEVRQELITELRNASGKFLLEPADRYSISMRHANSLVGACRLAAGILAAPSQSAAAVREALQLGLDAVMQTFEHVETNDDLLLAQMRHEAISAALATPAPSAASTDEPVPTSRVNDELLQACKGAAEWLSGWASADPYLSNLQVAIRNAEATPSTANTDAPLAGIAVPSDAILAEWAKWLDWDTGLSIEDEVKQLRFLYMRFIAPAVIATATPPSSGNADAVREAFNALSMWCTSARFKIRGRGGFDDQTEREIGIGLVEAEIDRRAAALSSAPVAGEWQDMETARLDGKPFLARYQWLGEHRFMVIRRSLEGPWWIRDGSSQTVGGERDAIQFTDWQALPAGPISRNERGSEAL